MNLLGAAKCRGRPVCLEDVECLSDGRATRRRWRHGDESVPAITAPYGLPPDRLVASEIFFCNQAAVALHLRGDRIGDATAIERCRTRISDQPDGPRQRWLSESRADSGG